MRQGLVRLSIVTVTLNNRVGLEKTFSSIASQTLEPFEWLVIDGGSVDSSMHFLEARSEHWMHWISEKDEGLYDAMNKGLNIATGDYVCFLNAGDILPKPDTLNTVASRIAEFQPLPDIVFGDSLEEAEGGSMLFKKARSASTIRYGMFTHHQAMFFSRNFVGNDRYGLLYRIAGDYDFTARMLMRGATTYYIEEPLCLFERGGTSMKSARRGRLEVLAVQQRVLHVGPLRRGINNALFYLSSILRGRFRRLYDSVRFRRFSGPSG